MKTQKTFTKFKLMVAVILFIGAGTLTTAFTPAPAPTACTPDLTLFEPTVSEYDVEINGVVLPQDGCPSITRLHWDWGDGQENDSWFPAEHTYASPGIYLVTATAYDQENNTAVETAQVSVGIVEWVGQIGGAAFAVAAQGDYAYVGIGPRMLIIDVSDLTLPLLVGQTDAMPDIVQGIVVVSSDPPGHTYAYVANGSGGMRIIDVSSPATPVEIGVYDATYAYDVAVAGNYAYVARGSGGLRIVDVSDPSDPDRIKSFYDVNPYGGLVVAGNYLYIADSGEWDGNQWVGGGLRILNVSNPADPSETGFYGTLEQPKDVAVAGNCAYVANEDDGLRIINVVNPTAPVEAGSLDTPGVASGVAIVGNYAYVADGGNGLRIINVANPAAPSETGFYNTSGHAHDVTIVGDHAYVADGSSGLRIIDVADPAAPGETGSYDGSGYAQDVAVAGDYAYVANGYSGLRVLNIATPSNPTQVGFSSTPADALVVVDNYAYTADSFGGLHILDVSNPFTPTQVGTCSTPGYAQNVAVAESDPPGHTYAYVTDGASGLRIIDVSNPANPTEVGFYDTPGRATGIAIAAGDPPGHTYAYVADGDMGLRIIDVTNPAVPVEVGTLGTEYAQDVTVLGNYAYVADGIGGLRIVNVANPMALVEVGSYQTSNARNVVVVGNQAYVADGSSGLHIVNILNPTSPTEAGSYDTPGYANSLAMVGNHVYVADNTGGLAILRDMKPSSISGRVLDGSGDPIAGIQVAVSAEYSTTTDASGQYTITDVLPGIHQLAPTTGGYFWSPTSRVIAVPPDITVQDFVARNFVKTVTPDGIYAVNYGDALTYTVRLVFPENRDLVLYDRMPTDTTYISGSLNAPGSVAYDLATDAIIGTLDLAATDPVTVSFGVRVGVTGTIGLAPFIINRACIYPVGGTLSNCDWSNEVQSYTYVWSVYLPTIMR